MTQYEFERDQARDALRAAEQAGEYTDCYKHHWTHAPTGGAVCTDCGKTVTAQEIA